MEEQKYEAIEIIVKKPADGESWFDRIFNLITESCSEDYEGDSCPCGLESMSGSGGSTLEGCYEYMRFSENWATVKTADLKLVLDLVLPLIITLPESQIEKAYQRLHEEAYWHDKFEEWLASLPEEDDDEL